MPTAPRPSSSAAAPERSAPGPAAAPDAHPVPAAAPSPAAVAPSLAAAALALDPEVSTVRVLFPDLHGVARGVDLPLGEADAAGALAFCSAVMATGLHDAALPGVDGPLPDLLATPDHGTLRPVPWEPGVVACLADVAAAPGAPPVADPRGAARRAAARLEALGLDALLGPELELFLVRPEEACGATPAAEPGVAYAVGPRADPGGVVRRLGERLAEAGLGACGTGRELGPGQHELNLRPSDPLDACDRAFLARAATKDLAATHGLLATFMGRPFNDRDGSGLHLHLSLWRDGVAAFAEPGAPDGLAPLARHAVAGLLAHAPGLVAVLCPTVNAYRRLRPDALVPVRADWGLDDRRAFVRVPAERGVGTRIELRVADGAANPHLAAAVTLAAVADGIRQGTEPPRAGAGAAPGAPALPRTLEAALDALEADSVLGDALGAPTLAAFVAVKRDEVDRHRAWVSDWERREYLRAL